MKYRAVIDCPQCGHKAEKEFQAPYIVGRTYGCSVCGWHYEVVERTPVMRDVFHFELIDEDTDHVDLIVEEVGV